MRQSQTRCLLGLPLLPAHDFVSALQDIRITIATDGSHSRQLRQPVAYVKHQRSISPNHFCVRDNQARMNNILKSYHSGLRQRIQVSRRLKLFSLTNQSHLQNVTVDNMADLQHLQCFIGIRRPKKKRNLWNDTHTTECIVCCDAGAYYKLQCLHAISHSLGIHSAGFLAEEVSDDDESMTMTASTSTNSSSTAVQLRQPQQHLMPRQCGRQHVK